MTKGETFPAFTAAHRSAALLRKLDEGQSARRAEATADEMRHSPSCQQLVIIRTAGYSVTVNRCDECGAISTARHSTTPSTTTEMENHK